MGQKKKIKKRRLFWRIFCAVILVGVLWAFGVNAMVKHSVSDRILSTEEAARLEDADCILILGCLVKNDGTPSDMLSDRLNCGLELYSLQVAPKLLMSGDHGREEYDEVGAMKRYAVEQGIDSSDVFMDHAGFSTYDSLYRAKEIFGAERIVIVTQKYHLYRALYIADALGMDAYGVAADSRSYRGQWVRDAREVLARNKDFFSSLFQPKPKYLGEKIPLTSDGNVTNDETWSE